MKTENAISARVVLSRIDRTVGKEDERDKRSLCGRDGGQTEED
jgi:hypothetical protein